MTQDQQKTFKVWLDFVSEFAKKVIWTTDDIREFAKENNLNEKESQIVCFWLSAQTLSAVFQLSQKNDGRQSWHQYVYQIIQWSENKLSETFDDVKTVLIQIFETNGKDWTQKLMKIMKKIFENNAQSNTSQKKTLKYDGKTSTKQSYQPTKDDLKNITFKYIFTISTIASKEPDVIKLCSSFDSIPKDKIIDMISLICCGFFFKTKKEKKSTTNDRLSQQALQYMFDTSNAMLKELFSSYVPASIAKIFKEALKEVCDDHKIPFINKANKIIYAETQRKK